MGKFKEEYDVLQNLEFALVLTYREHPEMSDYDAMDAVKGLVRTYKAERDRRPAPELRLNPPAQEAYNLLREFCEWRLGRQPLEVFQEGEEEPMLLDIGEGALTLDEVIACLQRILRSIERWNREMGRRGYYNLVSQFVR